MSYECCGDGHAAGDAFLASIRFLNELYKIILNLPRKFAAYSDSLNYLLWFVFLVTCSLVIIIVVNLFFSSTNSLLAGANQYDWLLRDRSRGAEPCRDEDAQRLLSETNSPGPSTESNRKGNE